MPRGYFHLKENYKFGWANDLIPLNPCLVYEGNNTTDTLNLLENIHQETLVFRFSAESCDVCVNFVISRLKNAFPDYAKNQRIMLIGSELNPRVKEGYYGKNTFSFIGGDMGLPAEKYNVPFLFIIDEDRISKMGFVPDKAYPELTDSYLINIRNRFFNQ